MTLGDSDDEFVATYLPQVYRLAYRLTGNAADAEDLTQDTFVRALRAKETFVAGNPGGWLHRICTNLFLDAMRRRKRIAFDAFPDGLADLMRDPKAGPEESYDMAHLDGEVRAALMALKPDLRAAVVLCDLEGMSYEDIAEAMNTKVGTVRSRIHRGRTQLRRALAHRAPRRLAAAAIVARVTP